MALAQGQAAAQARATNAAPAAAVPAAGSATTAVATTRNNAPGAAATHSVQASEELSGEFSGFILPSLEFELPKANAITLGKVTCSGVAVQAFKAKKHPFQLVNPAAPAPYGSGHDNVVKSPFLGGASLLKVLSIDF
jgi:hypothetical protein